MPESEKKETFSADELALIGRVEKEITFLNEYKIKMHTLNSRENLDALRTTDGINDTLIKFDIIKKSTLIQCIDSINGNKVSLEFKEKLIYGLQPALVEDLYVDYMKMIDEQERTLAELKKN